jgi:hypothetical protein
MIDSWVNKNAVSIQGLPVSFIQQHVHEFGLVRIWKEATVSYYKLILFEG